MGSGIVLREPFGPVGYTPTEGTQRTHTEGTHPWPTAFSWSKITLFDDAVDSDVPDDPFFLQTLAKYFPDELHKYEDAMQAHRLKREIIATVLANRLIDAGGPLMLMRIRERTNTENAEICRAFEAARQLLSYAHYRSSIHALDNKVAASAQTLLQQLGADAIQEVSTSLLRRAEALPISEAIERYQPAFELLDQKLADAVSGYEAALLRRRVATLSSSGIGDDLAARGALMPLLPMGIDLMTISERSKADLDTALTGYLRLGETLRLDRLRAEAGRHVDDASYWERLATRRLIEDLRRHQADATAQILSAGEIDAWLSQSEAPRKRLLQQLSVLSSAKANFAQFTLAADAVRGFMTDTL